MINLRTLVTAADLAVDDIIDFGPEAVQPRIWRVAGVEPTAEGQLAVDWGDPRVYIEGVRAEPWMGTYAPSHPMRRVPASVLKALIATYPEEP